MTAFLSCLRRKISNVRSVELELLTRMKGIKTFEILILNSGTQENDSEDGGENLIPILLMLRGILVKFRMILEIVFAVLS